MWRTIWTREERRIIEAWDLTLSCLKSDTLQEFKKKVKPETMRLQNNALIKRNMKEIVTFDFAVGNHWHVISRSRNKTH